MGWVSLQEDIEERLVADCDGNLFRFKRLSTYRNQRSTASRKVIPVQLPTKTPKSPRQPIRATEPTAPTSEPSTPPRNAAAFGVLAVVNCTLVRLREFDTSGEARLYAKQIRPKVPTGCFLRIVEYRTRRVVAQLRGLQVTKSKKRGPKFKFRRTGRKRR